jgi:hypothetical protein
LVKDADKKKKGGHTMTILDSSSTMILTTKMTKTWKMDAEDEEYMVDMTMLRRGRI